MKKQIFLFCALLCSAVGVYAQFSRPAQWRLYNRTSESFEYIIAEGVDSIRFTDTDNSVWCTSRMNVSAEGDWQIVVYPRCAFSVERLCAAAVPASWEDGEILSGFLLGRLNLTECEALNRDSVVLKVEDGAWKAVVFGMDRSGKYLSHHVNQATYTLPEEVLASVSKEMNAKVFSDRRDWAFGYGGLMHILDIYTQDLAAQNEQDYQQYYYFGRNEYQGEDYVFAQFPYLLFRSLLKELERSKSLLERRMLKDPEVGHMLGSLLTMQAALTLDAACLYEFLPTDVTNGINKYGNDVTGLTIPLNIASDSGSMPDVTPRRATRTEAAAYIEDLLTRAEEYLDDYIPAPDRTIPCLDVLEGVMARLYLWTEDYTKAGYYAQMAISHTHNWLPITQAEGMSTTTGFNDIGKWMWGATIKEENLWSKLANWTGMIVNESYFGYCGPDGGCANCLDARMYKRLSDTDWRKLMYKAPKGSVLDGKNVYINNELGEKLPDYAATKFRPGGGELNDYAIACATSYPLMRVEEMYFIMAEAVTHLDAARGRQLLERFMKEYRDPQYTCTATETDDIVEEIVFQKRIELWGEGRSFFDIKRLNLSVTRGYEGTNHLERERFNTTGRPAWMNMVFPKTAFGGALIEWNNPDPSGLYNVQH